MTMVIAVADHGMWGNGTVMNPVVVLLSMELVGGTLLAEVTAGTEFGEHWTLTISG